jgi:hypothetical protein
LFWAFPDIVVWKRACDGYPYFHCQKPLIS